MKITDEQRALFSALGKESWKKRKKRFKNKAEMSAYFADLAKKKLPPSKS